MDEFLFQIKVPKDRVAVLIGQKGAVKKELEEATKTKISIDSKDGDVTIVGENALGLFDCKEVVKAVARGFNPEIARLLLKGDYVLEIINIKEFSGSSKKALMRLRGRVIGAEGKARKHIENMTSTYISVYGNTISIIGESENVMVAKRVIESLLSGSPHSSVYKWLEKKKKELFRKEFDKDVLGKEI